MIIDSAVVAMMILPLAMLLIYIGIVMIYDMENGLSFYKSSAWVYVPTCNAVADIENGIVGAFCKFK